MKFKVTYLTMLACVMFFAQLSFAQSIGDYQSASSGDWTTTPASRWDVWDGDSWEDAVSAPNSSSGVITILSTHNITVGLAAVTADQVVVASGGTLTVNTVLTIDDGLGTDLEVDGTLTLNSTLATGTGTPAGNVDGVLDWIGGTLDLATTVSVVGTVNISGANKSLTGVLTNNGVINWTASQVTFNDGVLDNNAIFNTTVSSSFNFAGTTNSFNNNPGGSFTKSTAAGNTTFNIPVTNAGNFNINAGAVLSTSATGSFVNSGAINFGGGTGLTLAGTVAPSQFNTGTVIGGTATLAVNGPLSVNFALNLPASITLTFGAGASIIGGTGSLVVNGTWTWTSGTLDVASTVAGTSTLTVQTTNKTLTATLTNNGTILWPSSNIAFADGVIENNGSITATGNTAFTFTSGAGNAFNNNASGTFTKNTGVGTTTINIPTTNAGSITITSGTVSITGANATFANSGSINFNSTTLTIAGTLAGGNDLNTGTTLNGTGTLSITASTDVNFAMTVPATVAFSFTGNTQVLGGTGSLTIPGTMTWSGGSISIPTTINGSGTLDINGALQKLLVGNTLTNNGTINWSAGDLTMNIATLNNNDDFVISAAAGDDITIVGVTTNTINNTGTITKTSAVNTNFTSPLLNNSGTIDVQAGTLTKNGLAANPWNNTGTINTASGATFAYTAGNATGPLTLDPGTAITGNGTFRANANLVTNLALNVPATVLTEFGQSATAPALSGTGSITINGIATWGGGTLTLPLTIATGATLNSNASKTISSTVTNNGTINLTDPTSGSWTLLNGTVTNNGVINDNFTILRTWSSGGGVNNFTNNGTYLKTVNTTINFNIGITVTNSAGASFGGIGTISFLGAFTNNGYLDPGGFGNTAIGVLNTTVNAVAPPAAATVRIRILNGSGADAGGHDSLSMAAVTNLANASLVVTENTSTPQQSYVIMTAPGPNGFTNNFVNTLIPLGYSISIDNTTNPSRVIVTKLTATLPLVWGDFTALGRNNKVNLTWSTLQEENTSHFVLEHSVDGRTFSTIASMPAAGNSTTTTNYSYNHNTPNLAKNNHYRIQQVDLNGRSTYSAVRRVKFNNGKVVAVQAVPNPVKNSLQLTVQLDNIKVIMTDRNGSTIRTYKFQAGVHQVNVSDLPAGVYQLGVYQENERIDVIRIVKM